MTARRLAAAFAVLMQLATAAFVIGVSIERSSGHGESSPEHTESDEGIQPHDDAESGHADETESEGAGSDAEDSETIAGIRVESTPIIVVGVVLSLALAGAALGWPRREVFAAAAMFCAAFALLDGRELVHQLDEQAGTVATVAALALVLHLGATGIAVLGLLGHRDERAAIATA